MKIFKTSVFILSFSVLFIVGHAVTFAANPRISSISPTTATVGDTVTVTGTGFDSKSTIVFIGGVCENASAAVISSVSPTSISFSVPLGLSGTCGVEVNAPYPYPSTYYIPGTVSNSVPMNINDVAPTITSIAPTTAHVGDVVTITGTNFDWKTNVQLPDRNSGSWPEWANIRLQSPTSLTFIVPFGQKGLRNLYVQHLYSQLKSNVIQLNILPIAPILNSITPTTVRAGVSYMTVRADYADNDAVLVFDDGTESKVNTACVMNGSNMPGNCFVVQSSLSVGSHTVYIKETDSGLTSNTKSFTVTDQPVITSVHFGVNSAGVEQLGIMGNGIGGKSIALIDGPTGVVATNKTSGTGVSDLYIAFDLSTKIGKGTHTVQLKETDTGKVSNTLSFTVDDASLTPPPDNCFRGICPQNTPPPVCTPPQTLVNNVCTTPPLVCTPPQTLVNNVCTPPQTSTDTTDITSAPALKQKLVQLITTLLQLVQQAAARGILSVDQLTSILNSIHIPQ